MREAERILINDLLAIVRDTERGIAERRSALRHALALLGDSLEVDDIMPGDLFEIARLIEPCPPPPGAWRAKVTLGMAKRMLIEARQERERAVRLSAERWNTMTRTR